MNRSLCHSHIPVERSESFDSDTTSTTMNSYCMVPSVPVRRPRNKKKRALQEKHLHSPLSTHFKKHNNYALKAKLSSPVKANNWNSSNSSNTSSNDDANDDDDSCMSRVSFVGGFVSETKLYDPKSSPLSLSSPSLDTTCLEPIMFRQTAANRRRSLELYSSLITTSSTFQPRSFCLNRSATLIQARVRGMQQRRQQYYHYQSNKSLLQIQHTQELQIASLENELARIRTRHQEDLQRIEQHKEAEMQRIQQEVMEEFEEQERRKRALLDKNTRLIHGMRLENKRLRFDNDVMLAKNLEMAQKNERMLKLTDQIHENIASAKASTAILEGDSRQIQQVADTWQQRIREFEQTIGVCELHHAAEKIIHQSTIRTIGSLLRHINQSCSDGDLAQSVMDSAKESMDAIARRSSF